MPNIISSLTTSSSALPNDGTLTAQLAATVMDDATQNPVEGVTVTWNVTGPGSTDVPSSTTDVSGEALANLKATGDGNIRVQATTADDTVGKVINVTASEPIPAPVVLNTSLDDQYTLDQYDIDFGVTAIIDYFPGAANGQQVTFYWGKFTRQFVINDPQNQFPYAINVSNDLPPEALNDGKYPVYYVVSDAAGNSASSSALTITVVNGGHTAPTLTAPEVPAADPYININDAYSGVTVTVAYPSMAEGDLIQFYWLAYDKDGNKIQQACTGGQYTVISGDTECTFDISTADDASLFFPAGIGYEGTADAYYTVTAAGQTIIQLSHTKTCLVDTVAP